MNICRVSSGKQRLHQRFLGKYFQNRVIRKLNMDAQQERAFDDFQAVFSRYRTPVVDSLNDSRTAIGELISSSSFDRGQAVQILGSVKLAGNSDDEELVNSFGELYDQLSDSQRQVLREKWFKHRRCNSRLH